MNWKKINAYACMENLREIEKNNICLFDSEHSIIYSDGKEELKISYKKMEAKE